MGLTSYNTRLRREMHRRDEAWLRVRRHAQEAGTQSREAISNFAGEMKETLSPSALVRQYPWASVAGALAAGFAVAPAVKLAQWSVWRAEAKAQAATVALKPGTQQVVIKVVDGRASVAGGGMSGALLEPLRDAALQWLAGLAGGIALGREESRVHPHHNGGAN